MIEVIVKNGGLKILDFSDILGNLTSYEVEDPDLLF